MLFAIFAFCSRGERDLHFL